MSSLDLAIRAGRKDSGNRMILDPFQHEIRFGRRFARLDEQDIAVLRQAWDHRGEALTAQSSVAVDQLCSKLRRCLGVCPIHLDGDCWTWDGTDRLVELSTCTL